MRVLLLLLLLASATTTATAADLADSPTDTLLHFTIVDQFDVEHTDSEFAGRVAVLLWADREGSNHARRWARTLERELESRLAANSVVMRTVAHVEGVPGFVKGRVLDSFSDEPEQWALLDWQGEFQAVYDLQADHCNLLVFGPDGRLLHRAAATGLEQTILDGVLSAVNEGITIRTGGTGPPGRPGTIQLAP